MWPENDIPILMYETNVKFEESTFENVIVLI